jgi:DNA-binding NarL/FixJ family response regulator
MRGLHALDPAINGAVLRQMRERDPLATLTPREREVFDGLARGQSNARIAVSLVISEGTVRTHVVSILNKLGLRDRAAITIFALRRGLLTLDDLP